MAAKATRLCRRADLCERGTPSLPGGRAGVPAAGDRRGFSSFASRPPTSCSLRPRRRGNPGSGLRSASPAPHADLTRFSPPLCGSDRLRGGGGGPSLRVSAPGELEACRSWAEIDGGALRHNLGVARECAGTAGLCAIVKADGYGHGIGIVAPLLAGGIEGFGVASLAEALELEWLGLGRRIHILGALLPGERAEAVARGFEVTVSEPAELEAFGALGGARVWLKADTGMGRAGCRPGELAALTRAARATAGVTLCGLTSHCPSADEEVEFTFAQLLAWQDLAAEASRGSDAALPRQIANSAALLGYRRPPDQLARPGLMLYGVSPLPEHAGRLRPALHWRARVALVRAVPAGTTVSYGRTWTAPTAARLATVTVGYADGYRRDYAPGEVLIRGRRCPIRGRVTMDQIVVDAAPAEEAGGPLQAGEVVTLLGRDGAEEITAVELSGRAGTIPWETLTTISKRVRRIEK